ncbi:NADP-dependent malic enzyme [Patescibacteria group bacterium]|nr:NADP-dependent malic enzyme [Patescibacteria group bacterium]MBU1500523.1 NADP-dependent malic enzyme [Patescibacteria group bacterium]MBU2080678.1 NADP-dependent malic enzyme [Patescibacteria group bacterium]MBU2123783.1 NADP-dependent malic enzyme [Patescibacteria group bacterium]MBU2194926.1 NADP-dependent malic enzyme [Patescibacteria group bacterium]
MKKGKRTPKQILAAFKETGARIETKSRVKLKKLEDLSLYYTPGVGVASEHLAAHPEETSSYSVKKNSVAVISDGSAVLGLGNIGPYGALPVMEGKALIFKEFAGIDAWPIVLNTQDPDEIVRTVLAIAPGWGGINLEDIASPQCFEIERRINDALPIPVMHDDQHGTAIVVLAGLINAAKVVKKPLKSLRIVVSGAGAAGHGVAMLLAAAGIVDIVALDRKGAIHLGRTDLPPHKKELALINTHKREGDLEDVMQDADVFIGLSGKGLLHKDHVRSMAPRSIVFAMANPVPEIMPDEAKEAGAFVIATGRSDFPNQINNALVFPGVFRGALDRGVRRITEPMKLKAARALAVLVEKPTATKIVPDMFDKRVVPTIAKAIR